MKFRSYKLHLGYVFTFDYLEGLKSLKKIHCVNCEVLDDLALAKLSYVRNSLEELILVFCPSITDLGLTYLYLLQ